MREIISNTENTMICKNEGFDLSDLLNLPINTIIQPNGYSTTYIVAKEVLRCVETELYNQDVTLLVLNGIEYKIISIPRSKRSQLNFYDD